MDTRSKSKRLEISHNQPESDKKLDDPIDPVEGTSSQDSEKTTDVNNPKSQSPEPNCSICLGNLENKSFTDSCFHTFCFVCLLEWSKVKAVCPLCKQPFKSIIHNVRSFEDYDQYHLRQEEQRATELEARRLRFQTTMTNERWWDHLRAEQQRQLALLRRPSRSTITAQWRRQRQNATSGYRRRIYASGMRIQEVRTATGRTMRYREVSPEFYQRNPACTHRLVPWLNRELNVLLSNQEDHVQFVLELIMDLIKRFDIRSEEFFQHIQPFTGTRTEHFVHEFYSFARSPYDMFSYDQRAVYGEPEDQPVHMIESSDEEDARVAPHDIIDLFDDEDDLLENIIDGDDEDDDEVIVVSPTGPSAMPADEIATSQDHPYSTSGEIREPADPTRSTMPGSFDMDFTPLLDRMQLFLASIDPQPESASSALVITEPSTNEPPPPSSPNPGPSTQSPQNDVSDTSTTQQANTKSESPQKAKSTEVSLFVKVKNESDKSDSETSDVIVVGYDKPWEERSPDELSSEDEEDVKAAIERKKQIELEKLEILKRLKKSRSNTRSRSRSRNRSRSRSRRHNRSRSRNRHRSRSYDRRRSNSRHRSRDRSRHSTRDRRLGHSRSRSRERFRHGSRERRWSRSRDNHRSRHHSRDHAISRSLKSKSRSPGRSLLRENRLREKAKRKRTRSPSVTRFSALGCYDYDDTKSRKAARQEKERSEKSTRLTSPGRHSSNKDSRRERERSRNDVGRSRRKSKSRSRSVEVVFRRRDRSKDRHRKDKARRERSPVDSLTSSRRRHKQDRSEKHSPSRSNSSKNKRRSPERRKSVSPKRKSSKKQSSRKNSTDSSDDEDHQRKHYKKNSTGHKKSSKDSGETSQPAQVSQRKSSKDSETKSSQNQEDKHSEHSKVDDRDRNDERQDKNCHSRERTRPDSNSSRDNPEHSRNGSPASPQCDHNSDGETATSSTISHEHTMNNQTKRIQHYNRYESQDRDSSPSCLDQRAMDNSEPSRLSLSDNSVALIQESHVINTSSDSEIEVVGASHHVENISSESNGSSDIQVTSQHNGTGLSMRDIYNRQRNYMQMLQEDIRRADGVIGELANKIAASHPVEDESGSYSGGNYSSSEGSSADSSLLSPSNRGQLNTDDDR